MTKTYREVVKQASEACEKAGVYDQTALLYLVELAQMERVDLYTHYEEPAPEELIHTYEEGMKRILAHEPMQYVLGYSWFYGYQFVVNPKVLIPRYETEELVAQILTRSDETFQDKKTITCVDIGTGSGAIAISLCKEEPRLSMIATDISEEAIEVAKQNANQLQVSVTFMVGDLGAPLLEKNIHTDILVCNPPYIPQEEQLEDSVKNYEPHVALFGGEDGLKYYRTLFAQAPKILNPQGFMAFEIGYTQKEALLQLVQTCIPGCFAEVCKDINGKDRMLFVYPWGKKE